MEDYEIPSRVIFTNRRRSNQNKDEILIWPRSNSWNDFGFQVRADMSFYSSDKEFLVIHLYVGGVRLDQDNEEISGLDLRDILRDSDDLDVSSLQSVSYTHLTLPTKA